MMTNECTPQFNRGLRTLNVFFLIWMLIPSQKNLAQEIQRPAIIGIASVELRTSEINQSINFYHGLLGFSCESDLSSTNQPESFRIQVNRRQCIQVEGGLPESQDERLTALGIQTSDVEGMRLYLKSKGIPVPDQVIKDKNNNAFFAILDPDGHQLKFIQPVPTENWELNKSEDAGFVSDRILHVGMTIENVKRANEFYEDILGFSEIWRGGRTDSTISWINMRLPESTDYLEYMLITSKPNRQRLGTLNHVALLIPNMQNALNVVRARGQQLDYNVAAPMIGRNNKWLLNLYDPDGTRVELMEPFTFR